MVAITQANGPFVRGVSVFFIDHAQKLVSKNPMMTTVATVFSLLYFICAVGFAVWW